MVFLITQLNPVIGGRKVPHSREHSIPYPAIVVRKRRLRPRMIVIPISLRTTVLRKRRMKNMDRSILATERVMVAG